MRKEERRGEERRGEERKERRGQEREMEVEGRDSHLDHHVLALAEAHHRLMQGYPTRPIVIYSSIPTVR